MKHTIIQVDLEPLREVARNAYHNRSFRPERRADQVVIDYTEELQGDLTEIVKAYGDRIEQDQIVAIQQRYTAKYTELLKTWLYSLSNTASAAIVGPARFPTERMRKKNEWADNHFNYFRSWRTRAKKAILKAAKPPVDELAIAERNLTRAKNLHTAMIAANKLIRKGGAGLYDSLLQLGLDGSTIGKILRPDYLKQTGFKPFELSNNKALISRLEIRVKELTQKKQSAANPPAADVIGGISILQNFEIDRVQIIFPGDQRPTKPQSSALQSHGFRFSPRNKAWQRQLTQAGNEAAKQVVTNF